jgi:hypothetical protein
MGPYGPRVPAKDPSHKTGPRVSLGPWIWEPIEITQGPIRLGCVLGSYLVVPPTGNPPIGLGNRSQPNWDKGPT